MRNSVAFLIAILLTAPPAAHAFTLSNFEAPESFVRDPEDGAYYVSNVNGGLTEKDANGYISKINPSGSIVVQRFIGGKKDGATLHAPKGMAIVGRTIFVADIDSVKAFDKRTRQPLAAADLTAFGAKSLSDLAYDGSRWLYVSDMPTDRIFRIDLKGGLKSELFKESPDLGNPNGLAVNPRTRNLMVATWLTGRLLEIDRNGVIRPLKKGLATLGGMDFDSAGNLYVSSFERGEVYKIDFFGRGALSTFLNGLTTPADISFDRRKGELLVPSFKGNKVATISRPLTPKK